jgi:hypothetical protein
LLVGVCLEVVGFGGFCLGGYCWIRDSPLAEDFCFDINVIFWFTFLPF